MNELCISYEIDDEFEKMVKSKSDKQHYSVAFELLTYSLFRLSNFSLIRHPETPTGNRPDFKPIVSDFKTFIECTLAGHSFNSLADKTATFAKPTNQDLQACPRKRHNPYIPKYKNIYHDQIYRGLH